MSGYKTPDDHLGLAKEDETQYRPSSTLTDADGVVGYLTDEGFRFKEEGKWRSFHITSLSSGSETGGKFYQSDGLGGITAVSGVTPDFSKVILEVDGSLVYTGDGEITTLE